MRLTLKIALGIILAAAVITVVSYIPVRNAIRGEETTPCEFHGGVESRKQDPNGINAGTVLIGWLYTCEDGDVQAWQETNFG